MKACFLTAIWLFAPIFPGTGQESPVARFNTLFTVKGSLKYNFLQFDQDISPDTKITSNRPLDLEIGFSYKDFSLGFSVNIPFLYDSQIRKSLSFDCGFKGFIKNLLFFEGLVKYYEGFHSETLTLTGAESGGEVDLKIILAGLSGAYIFNPDHSLRSVYNLDRKQRTSNASLLVGAGGFYSALYADNGPPNSGNQLTLYFGPNAGYSYIWILKNNFFINLLGILGVNGSVKNGEFYLGFSGLPKFALGWHGKDWSFNAVLSNTLLLAMKKMKFDNIINSGTFSITFSKRF